MRSICMLSKAFYRPQMARRLSVVTGSLLWPRSTGVQRILSAGSQLRCFVDEPHNAKDTSQHMNDYPYRQPHASHTRSSLDAWLSRKKRYVRGDAFVGSIVGGIVLTGCIAYARWKGDPPRPSVGAEAAPQEEGAPLSCINSFDDLVEMTDEIFDKTDNLCVFCVRNYHQLQALKPVVDHMKSLLAELSVFPPISYYYSIILKGERSNDKNEETSADLDQLSPLDEGKIIVVLHKGQRKLSIVLPSVEELCTKEALESDGVQRHAFQQFFRPVSQDSDSTYFPTELRDTPQSKTQQSETQQSETQQSETQHSETQQSETQQSETQQSETQQSETQHSETQQSETQPPTIEQSDHEHTDASTSLRGYPPSYVTYNTFEDQVVKSCSQSGPILVHLMEDSCFLCFLMRPFINTVADILHQHKLPLTLKLLNLDKNDFPPHCPVIRSTPSFVLYNNSDVQRHQPIVWKEYKPSDLIDRIIRDFCVPESAQEQLKGAVVKLQDRFQKFGLLSLWTQELKALETFYTRGPEHLSKDIESEYTSIIHDLVTQDERRIDKLDENLKHLDQLIGSLEADCVAFANLIGESALKDAFRDIPLRFQLTKTKLLFHEQENSFPDNQEKSHVEVQDTDTTSVKEPTPKPHKLDGDQDVSGS